MTSKMRLALAGASTLLLILALAPPPAQGQALKDHIVQIVYLHVKPDQAREWLVSFKKHFEPVLQELRQQENLLGWHLFVPGVHHPGHSWTHAIALACKDRASQGIVEAKLEEVFSAIPAAEAEKFFAATDPARHFDDEWRELDLAAVTVPEEDKEEKGEPGEAEAKE